MKLTDEAKAIIEAKADDIFKPNKEDLATLTMMGNRGKEEALRLGQHCRTYSEGAEFAMTSPELLAAQGLYTAQEKQDDVDKRADELIDIIDDKQLEIISKRAELATLTQQLADYREALEFIADIHNARFNPRKAARAVLDKYPQTTKG
jgi:hypothetical protein